eukprot:c16463_g1_i2.p1 GENE.c16463_g1_i2~~c16463_g1_i2.p1  ORF type:complete len:552 (+),score=120.76 c16463_g1_i2:546-2201(+)
MACIYRHTAMACALLKSHPGVCVDSYHLDNGETPFEGENALHIAIVNRDLQLVNALLGQPRPYPQIQLKARVTGSFFARGKACYYGETPLSFAVCTNQPKIVAMLVALEAELTVKDKYNNTLFHLCVVHDIPEMLDFLTHLMGTEAATQLSSTKNDQNLTPLGLAAYNGASRMFAHLMDKSKKVAWTYGPVTCTLYPMEGFDSSYDHKNKGAIQHIVDGEHIDLLMQSRVIHLMDEKWKAFGKSHFTKRLLLTGAYLLTFTVLTLWPPVPEDSPEMTMLKNAAQLVVFVGALAKAMNEGTEFTEAKFLRMRGAGFIEHSFSLGFSLSVLSVAVLRLSKFLILSFIDKAPWFLDNEVDLESIALAAASLSGWLYMLFFAMGYKNSGPLVVMIYHMFIWDLSRFSLIYLILMIGFAQAFSCIEHDGFRIEAFSTNLKACFYATVGDFQTSTGDRFPTLKSLLLVSYAVIMTITMLNLLIAMMGNSFSQLAEKTEKLWRLEKARIIFSIEQQIGQKARESYKYWIEIDGKRYLQVEEVNPSHFGTFDNAVRGQK